MTSSLNRTSRQLKQVLIATISTGLLFTALKRMSVQKFGKGKDKALEGSGK